MRPTTWWPGTIGRRREGRSPVTICRSVRQTAQAVTSRRTSPTPGVGSGRSTLVSQLAAGEGSGAASSMAIIAIPPCRR